MSCFAISNKSKLLWGIPILSRINPSINCLALSILARNVGNLTIGVGIESPLSCFHLIKYYCTKAETEKRSDAAFEVACMLEQGISVAKDPVKACDFFIESAKPGAKFGAFAAHKLGLAYSTGTGVPKDNAKAVSFFEDAVRWGRKEAVIDLINHYRRENDESSALVWETKQQLATSTGTSIVNIKLDVFAEGLKYLKGDGIAIDLPKAILFFKYAVEKEGHCDAASELGQMYLNGLGTTIDLVEARKFFEIGAKDNGRYRAYASHQLGIMYSKGLGGEAKSSKAISHLINAISWGRTKASLDLVIHYKHLGNHVDAEFWEQEYYAAWKLKSEQTFIATIGGNLLTTTTIYPLNEESLMSAPSLKNSYETERLKVQMRLENTGMLPKGETISYRPTGGYCLGINLKFVCTVLNKSRPLSKLELIAGAKNFITEAGAEAIAIHSAYEHYFNTDHLRKVVAIFSTVPAGPKQVELQAAKARSEIDQAALKLIYRAYGYHLISLPHLGIPGQSDEITCLNAWLLEPDGSYDLSILGKAGYHAMILIKTASNIFIWDPAFGLIEFPITTTTSANIIKYLVNKYPVITDHKLDFRRIEVI